jgi:hypothetical protein
MTGALIDTHALLKLAYSSLIAGVAVAVIFSVAILGAIRSGDMRRAHRSAAATAYAALAVVGVLGTVAIIVVGLILVAQKS